MINAGTDLKYRVMTQIPGFNLRRDNFSIIVKNRWEQTKYIVPKEDMMMDDNGNYYLTLSDVQNGVYRAFFTAEKEDTDFDTGIQHIVDKQVIAVVGECDCEEYEHICHTDGAYVVYQRVWTVCVGGYVYLTEEDGTPILDADGNKIFLKSSGKEQQAETRIGITGPQLEELLIGRNDNGRIDTIPEMQDVMGGMREDTELGVTTEEDIDNMMNRILNRR